MQQRLKGISPFYAVVAVFAVAALVFLYVLLYRFLASRLDDISAAAILCGANLLLIALVVRGTGDFQAKASRGERRFADRSSCMKITGRGIFGVELKDMNFG